MTLLTSLARALAAERGRAEPIRTVRHVHLSARPLVFIPLQLAGEANAPLAALIGDDPARPRMLTVYEPRDRTQRFAWAADLAAIVLAHVDEYARPPIGDDDTYPDAPQLLVPNDAGISFTRLLGRSTRFRRTTGEYAVPESVPVLGRWLSFFAERSEAPASALLLSMTDALTAHWATGQSAVEDANLAALLGWIDPPRGMTGAAAARTAEDPVLWPPAGPATHPDFDNEILDRCLEAVRAAAGDGAGDEAALDRARAAMAAALRTQLAPTWSLMWRGIELLRALPEADYLAKGWESDRWYFTSYVRWLADGGAPQARRDSAVSAARRLNSLERSQQEIEVKSAFDDPLLMAEQRMSGEAFAGVVVQAQPDRVDDSRKRRVLRPWITVETTDDVLVEPGASLKSADRPSQRAVVVDVTRTGERTMVTLELSGGMGNSLTARPGTVPGLGEVLCYTTRSGDFRPAAKWPDAAETPWTHGGPPPEYVPNDDDAGEAWS